jgi:phage terminase large subunit
MYDRRPGKLTLKRGWFNPLYFILNDLLKIESIRIILVYGGKSSAKTVSIAQVLSKECVVSADSSICFRKQSNIIPTTLKKSFNLAIEQTRIQNAFQRMEFSYRCFNQAEIVLKGLDDEEKAKGVESYKYLYIDELNHFAKEEYDQFNMSLRGIAGQKILASWNPVSETSWVKKELVDQYEFVETKYKLPCEDSFVKISTDGKVVLIKTTYQDNYWINGSPDGSYGYRDENLIAEYEKLKITDFNAYRVNVKGEWGIRRTGGEFWKQFSEEKHVKPVSYLKAPIHVTLDENTKPYVTVSIWQVIGQEIRQIHEMPCKTPENNAPKAARKFIQWLNRIEHQDLVYVYGDPSSKKGSTSDENNRSFYDKFFAELAISKVRYVNRVIKSAPEVALSAAFINEIYETELNGWKIVVNVSCTTSIEDYLVVKEAPTGEMLKPTALDPETNKRYETHGHFSDAKRYFLIELLKDEWYKWKQRSTNLLMQSGYFR